MQMNKSVGGGSSFDTDWDVEQYRHEWDSDEQWEVRREFILAHKNTFPEDRLVCLAQVYANIEFMGCSYNDDVMKQVQSLAEGLSTDHRDRKKNLQEIKFVKESNQSGVKRPHEDSSPQESKFQRFSGQNTNRSSASSYFGSDTPSGSFVPSQSANNYQTQSYYTRDYKSTQVQGGRDRYSGSGEGSGTTSSLSHVASQQTNWTPGNEKLLSLTMKFKKIGEAIESDEFDAAGSYNRLAKFAIDQGLVVKKERVFKKKEHCLQIYIGEVLAITNKAQSKKGILSDAVLKLYKIFKAKSWKLITKNSEMIELFVTAEKRNDPIPPEPDLNNHEPMTCEEKIDNNHEPMECEGGGIEDLIAANIKRALHGFVLVDRLTANNGVKSAVYILTDSANFTKKQLTFEQSKIMDSGTQFHRCVVHLEGLAIEDGRGTNAQMAKREAAEAALVRLRSLFCTLQIKRTIESDRLSRGSVMDTTNKNEIQCEEKVIGDDNVGNKLLRMMGWTGGGLGKEDNKGIAEPVKVNAIYGRKGLGLSEERGVTKDFIHRMKDVIHNYATSDSNDSLTFSSEFSKEERAEMHRIAVRFKLKSNSSGTGSERFLILRRRHSSQELIRLLNEAGGAMDNYQLLPPCHREEKCVEHSVT